MGKSLHGTHTKSSVDSSVKVPPLPTCAVVIHHGGRPPLQVLHKVQNGMAEGRVVGVQVDIESVLVIQRVMLPSKLYVGDLQGVANRLDGIGAGALGRSKDCYDPQSELVTGWKRKGGREGWSLQWKGPAAGGVSIRAAVGHKQLLPELSHGAVDGQTHFWAPRAAQVLGSHTSDKRQRESRNCGRGCLERWPEAQTCFQRRE